MLRQDLEHKEGDAEEGKCPNEKLVRNIGPIGLQKRKQQSGRMPLAGKRNTRGSVHDDRNYRRSIWSKPETLPRHHRMPGENGIETIVNSYVGVFAVHNPGADVNQNHQNTEDEQENGVPPFHSPFHFFLQL